MWPGKLKGDPNKRSGDKYYHFHRDHGHDISECYDLKQQIEALIIQGKLQQFISKERTNNSPLTRTGWYEGPKPPLGDIRMIMGGTIAVGLTRKARKTYLQMVKSV